MADLENLEILKQGVNAWNGDCNFIQDRIHYQDGPRVTATGMTHFHLEVNTPANL
jgi:hypothetical protein